MFKTVFELKNGILLTIQYNLNKYYELKFRDSAGIEATIVWLKRKRFSVNCYKFTIKRKLTHYLSFQVVN